MSDGMGANLLRVYALHFDDATWRSLLDSSSNLWRVSGRFRLERVYSVNAISSIRESCTVLNWPTGHYDVSRDSYRMLQKAGAEVLNLSMSGAGIRLPGVPREEVLGPVEVISRLHPDGLNIRWPDADPDVAIIRSELGESLPLILEKYFPAAVGAVDIHKVTDGWSGTKLVRLAFKDVESQYFLKLFSKRSSFEEEWDAFAGAQEWLGDSLVPLVAIPMLAPVAADQARPFDYGDGRQTSAAEGGNNRCFPVCYRSGRVTGTLKDLYRTRKSDYLKHAYQRIVRLLSSNQRSITMRAGLHDILDVGPAVKEGDRGRPIVENIRSPHYSEKGRKHFGDGAWNTKLLSLESVLTTARCRWIYEPCEISLGRVHGDANARNFLFNASMEDPYDVQVIDYGSYASEAARIFDLAQLESDLKVVLMSTEVACNGMGDWDPEQFQKWCNDEQQLCSLPFGMAPSGDGQSCALAFSLVGVIRKAALMVSPGDPDGRAYHLALLYWTLRKLRLSALPHLKRLYAVYAAMLICGRFDSWRPK
jgi:hypothetical protein